MKKSLATLIGFVFVVSIALAQSLSLTIGNSVAGQNYAMKTAAFVFRVNGCPDLPKLQITAVAEGLVGGARRSAPLRSVPLETQPGVYAIADQISTDGK